MPDNQQVHGPAGCLLDASDPCGRRSAVAQVHDLGADARLGGFGKLGGRQVTAEHPRLKPGENLGNASPETMPGTAYDDCFSVEPDLHRSLVLWAAPEWRARPDRVEQRPVAILEHMAFRVGRPWFQPKRADPAIVAGDRKSTRLKSSSQLI